MDRRPLTPSPTAPAQAPSPAAPPAAAHPWLVVALVCVGALVGQLDATIVQLALPTLGRAFAAPLQHISWVALAYLIAFASFLPVFGRLCEIYGRKTLYLAGYALFIGASALCALAADLPQLLAFRFLQGIGGALLGANSISILVATVPGAARGRALGYFAAAQAIGMSAGPALGGILLEALGWRWIFGVTVPFGAVAMLLGWLVLPRTPAPPRRGGFDWAGALMIGPALVLNVASLNHLSHRGAGLALMATGLGVAALLLWRLVRHEDRAPAPLINPRLYRAAGFRSGAAAVTLAYALLYGMFFLMSFALEHGFGETPRAAGFRLAIIPVAIGLTAPFSSDVRAALGAGRIGAVALALCLGGLATLMLTLGLSPDHHLYDTLAFALIGVGLGLFIAPNSAATIAAAPADLSGAAGSLLNLMRVLGTSLGVAVGATTLSWQLGEGSGAAGNWTMASEAGLLDAVRNSLPVLVPVAVLAAVLARRTVGRPARDAARAPG